MTSRERVTRALNHQEPDRVPIDLGGHGATTMNKFVHSKLMSHLGFDNGDAPAINLLQVSAKDMETDRLKREYGKDIAFWGGIDTQQVLPHGTTTDVEEEVKRRIRGLAPEGGYVLAQVHIIQPGVPMENIVMMYEAAEKYGIYPINC